MALEFDLIDTFFKPLSFGLSNTEVGIGDDGAVLSMPDNHQLVVVTDTLVSGVHFPVEASAYDIGWKALAVNLSDLAAMGAQPAFYSLALTLPENDENWLADFAKGLTALSAQFNIPLIGGDTTKGPLTVTVTAQGWVPSGQAILRSGAKQGDLICVTETIGDGALGLKVAFDALAEIPGLLVDSERMLQALNRPEPQLSIAPGLVGLVNSAIDISDGLLADLGHIIERSQAKTLSNRSNVDLCYNLTLGAEIELDKLPLSPSVASYISATDDWSLPLSGGDDYQLCMTLPEKNLESLLVLAAQDGVRVTVVGRIVHGVGVVCIDQNGEPISHCKAGYSHF